jgi:hypothetical protein
LIKENPVMYKSDSNNANHSQTGNSYIFLKPGQKIQFCLIINKILNEIQFQFRTE